MKQLLLVLNIVVIFTLYSGTEQQIENKNKKKLLTFRLKISPIKNGKTTFADIKINNNSYYIKVSKEYLFCFVYFDTHIMNNMNKDHVHKPDTTLGKLIWNLAQKHTEAATYKDLNNSYTEKIEEIISASTKIDKKYFNFKKEF